MSHDPPSMRPRATRLQFSLRLLLLALTAFAIGFPIWYRWPYEEVEYSEAGGAVSRTGTFQRQWGGSRLRHGKQTLTQGKLKQIFHHRRGESHGPYLVMVGDKTVESGQYVDGFKEGTWTYYDKTIAQWHRGRLDGKCEFRSDKGSATTAIFQVGRLIQFNGSPIDDHLFDVLRSGAVDERTAHQVEITTEINVVEVPLKDTVLYVQEANNIPIELDRRRLPDLDLPITAAYSGLPLSSVLTLLTAPHGLACDYRYGLLWITTADDAKKWQDSTGVAEIQPPKGSSLDRAWNESVGIRVVTSQLSPELTAFAANFDIEIDTQQIEPSATENQGRFPISYSAHGRPFRHVLGQLLDETGCRCKLDGETLIILPPESKSDKSPSREGR